MRGDSEQRKKLRTKKEWVAADRQKKKIGGMRDERMDGEQMNG